MVTWCSSSRTILIKQLQLFLNEGSVGVSIAEQHPRIPMSAYRGNLWHLQADLEETRDSFMSQIVKVQVFDLRALQDPVPSQPERHRGRWKELSA
jgi:hypothetical protein